MSEGRSDKKMKTPYVTPTPKGGKGKQGVVGSEDSKGRSVH